MSERPDLTRRSAPRPAAVTNDPADPILGAADDAIPGTAQQQPGTPAGSRSGPQQRLAPIAGGAATVAIQYRLTPDEADVLYQMQEARGDRRGIDTMRWLLNTYGDDLIAKATASRRRT